MIAAFPLVGCDTSEPDAPPPDPQGWSWDLPADVPPPWVPPTNPMTRAKVALGRALFDTPALSGPGTLACRDCHHPERGLADDLDRSPGVHGDLTHRNAPGLQHVGWYATLTWANPALTTLEQQLLVPLFNEDPAEMGLVGQEDIVLGRIADDPALTAGFVAAFPDDDTPVHLANLRDALAAYLRSLVAFDSPWDRVRLGRDDQAMSTAALRGWDLFRSDRLGCTGCHDGWHLSASLRTAVDTVGTSVFVHDGLYGTDADAWDAGLGDATGDPADDGRFRPPSLRNVAVTGPYGHDGSIATLEEVLRAYARGGRLIDAGDVRHDGREHPNLDDRVSGFVATEQDIHDLLAFLDSLTSPSFVSDSLP